MPTLTFTPVIQLTRTTPEYPIRQFQFGQGYEQVQEEGFNEVRYNTETAFNFTQNGNHFIPPLADGRAFFEEVKTSVPFEYTCPYVGLHTWRCSRWSINPVVGDLYRITASLRTWQTAAPLAILQPEVLMPKTIQLANANVSTAFTLPGRTDNIAPIIASAVVGATAAAQTLILQVKWDAGGWVNTSARVQTSTAGPIYWDPNNLARNVAPAAGIDGVFRLKFSGTATDTINGGVQFYFNG